MLKKISLIILLIAAIILGAIAVNPFPTTNAQTNQVSGHITADTTWTQNSSPYNLASDLFVDPSVTLTIEPGVTVNYNKHNLYVNGTLNAQGTETQKIQFNSGKKWDGTGPEYTTSLTGASKLSYSTISGRIILDGDVQVTNSFIDGEISIQKGNPIISNNWINGSMLADGIGLYYASDQQQGGEASATISNNEITNCYRGIAITAGDHATITQNYLHNNTWAIVSGTSGYSDVRGADSTILNNTVKNNEGGIIVIGKISPVIAGNNIEGNKQLSLSLAASKSDENASRVWGTNNQDATNNWWGTTDPAAISQSIIDHNDNSPSGIVNFTPYLTEPNPQAMPINNLPTPTPLPSTTATPSPTSPVSDNIPKLQFSCQSTVSSTIRVNIKGNLTIDNNGIPNVPILFAYSVNSGASWVDLTTVNTSNTGNFEILWTPSATGNYLIKAVWAGNTEYAAANTTVNFAISPYDTESFFSVNSNSTLSTLSFDSAAKQLSFTVEGQSGTTGYVDIYIPKSLMTDMSGLTVHLDDTQIEYTSQSKGDYWVVSFTYHHSSHQINMNLYHIEGGVGGWTGWILVAAILIPLAIVIAVLAVGRSKTRKAREATEAPNRKLIQLFPF